MSTTKPRVSLITGLFTLAAEVENPKPDMRRTREWSSRQRFPVGTYKVTSRVKPTCMNIDLLGWMGGAINSNANPEQFEALAPHLKWKDEADWNVGEIINMDGGGFAQAEAVLAMLVEEGVVKPHQIREAVKRAGAMDDQQFADFLAKHGLK